MILVCFRIYLHFPGPRIGLRPYEPFRHSDYILALLLLTYIAGNVNYSIIDSFSGIVDSDEFVICVFYIKKCEVAIYSYTVYIYIYIANSYIYVYVYIYI